MEKGRWSSSSIWEKFYYKEVPSDKEKYHKAVFQNFQVPKALKEEGEGSHVVTIGALET